MGVCDYRLLLARVVVLLLFFLDDVQLVLRVGKAGQLLVVEFKSADAALLGLGEASGLVTLGALDFA